MKTPLSPSPRLYIFMQNAQNRSVNLKTYWRYELEKPNNLINFCQGNLDPRERGVLPLTGTGQPLRHIQYNDPARFFLGILREFISFWVYNLVINCLFPAPLSRNGSACIVYKFIQDYIAGVNFHMKFILVLNHLSKSTS